MSQKELTEIFKANWKCNWFPEPKIPNYYKLKISEATKKIKIAEVEWEEIDRKLFGDTTHILLKKKIDNRELLRRPINAIEGLEV